MTIPAVVTAGDRRAAKPVYGQSKVYLEIAGRPLVVHVVETLQRVPEVSEVWVVGDAQRLRGVFEQPEIAKRISKPLHILEQFRNLYENAWESYRRALPGAGPDGRDPESEADLDQRVLYVSGDLPFATPQEISDCIRKGVESDCDYALGLVTDASLVGFAPDAGEPGISMALFNLREGRVRQSNLHLARPGRIVNRFYIEAMYEARHQREAWDIVKLAWELLTVEGGGFTILYYYALMHLAGVADRWGLRRVADVIRQWIPIARIERGCSTLLGTRFRFVVTDVGGCAIDIDLEQDYDAAVSRYEAWKAEQEARAERLLGPPALPATAGSAVSPGEAS